MVQRRAKVIQCFLKNGETGDEPNAHHAVLCSGQDAHKGPFFEKQRITCAVKREAPFFEKQRITFSVQCTGPFFEKQRITFSKPCTGPFFEKQRFTVSAE